MTNDDRTRPYVCRYLRLCTELISKGFVPYAVVPCREAPCYKVFLFWWTPDLQTTVNSWVAKGKAANEKN